MLHKQLVEYLEAKSLSEHQFVPISLFQLYLTVWKNGIVTWIVAFIT